MNKKETEKLFNESTKLRENCNLCSESKFNVGKKTGYGVIIYKTGNLQNGWFATLSPKTGGNPKLDFTIQLMPQPHLTHFSQIDSFPGMAKNFGISFSKLCRAMAIILMRQQNLNAESEKKELSVPIASYGKCTTWKEKKEHLHIKIFPFRGAVGQPYTVDSSFGRKDIFRDKEGSEFVKMAPVRKKIIEKERFEQLSRDLIEALK